MLAERPTVWLMTVSATVAWAGDFTFRNQTWFEYMVYKCHKNRNFVRYEMTRIFILLVLYERQTFYSFYIPCIGIKMSYMHIDINNFSVMLGLSYL